MKKITTTLRKLNPEAAEMWCYDLNGEHTPDFISGRSDYEAYFRCLTNHKHIFKKKISKMTSRDGRSYGCIYCGPNSKIVFQGETDFFTKCPEALNMWCFELNKDIDPTNTFPNSNKYANFKCDKNHISYRKIMDFYHSPKCSVCEKEKSKLVHQFPNTRLFWDNDKNLDVNIDDIIQSSRYNAYLKCPNCKYEWKSQVVLWNSRRYCPCCGFDGMDSNIKSNSSIINQNPIITFRMANPIDAEMWRYDMNGNMTPDNILYGSNKSAYFRCKKGHEFERIIYTMTTSDGKPKGCPYCNDNIKKAYPGENDLFTKCPNAKVMWDHELNIDIDPKSLLQNSAIKAHFVCSAGHKFIRKIQQFSSNPKCPECEFIEKHSIAVTRPEMLKFWDYEKNTISPYSVSPSSKNKVFWKCQKCDYSWESVISNRASALKNKCPSCDIGRAFSKNQIFAKTFRNFNPEASKMWMDELNKGLTPDNVSEKSGKTVYLQCANNPEHIYKKRICYIPNKKPFGCPYCQEELKIASPGVDDIFSVCPECKEMWDWDKNEGIDPYHMLPENNTQIHLKCKRKHEFKSTVKKFVKSPKCHKCETNKDFISNYPHMVKQWHDSKNIGIDINYTLASMKDTAWWECKKCGYEWQAQISTRKISKGLCPCCENRTVVAKGITDLFSIVPDLKRDYDINKNQDINEAELSTANHIPVWWKCHLCSHEWQASPFGRLHVKEGNYKIRSCPACAGIVRIKTYADEYPELINRFIKDKNGCNLSDLKGTDTKRSFLWHCNICGEDFNATLGSMIRSKDTQNKGCPYCAGKKVVHENSFAYLHPEVMDEYDPNNTIDPHNVTEHSTKKAKWICRNNTEHIWEATFYSRAKGEGGCNMCRGWSYNKFFAVEHPEFEPYYDTEKNSRNFSSLTNMSNEYVWWKCDQEHSFEWTVMNFSRLGRFECPICTNKIVVTGKNDLESQHPKLVKEWSSNNVCKPFEITKTDLLNALWICPTCHGEYSYPIREREVDDDSCPYCCNRRILAGLNSLADTNEELAKEWSHNNERKPTQVMKSYALDVLWICPTCHGEYSYPIRKRELDDDSCPYCNNDRVLAGYNSLVDTDFDLSKEWSPSNERGPETYLKTNKSWVYWLCTTCSGEYRYPINEREVGDDSCPYCSNRRILAGLNSLADTNEELAKEWSHNNERKPSEVMKSYALDVLWICPTCHGEYSYPIREREVGDDSCPYCNNDRVLAGYNSLVDTDFDLSKEWSPSNERGPETYLKTNKSWVYWLCTTCSGEYRYPINEREVGDDSCPYCKGIKALPGYNSFKVKHHDLMEEWDNIDNYILCDPDTIIDNYSDNVWWICKVCSKKYQMSPKRKLYFQKRNMISCLYCKGLRQKRRHFF